MLSLRRGNYSTSVYFWFVYIAPVSPSSMPSTHSPRTELSCCQRWLGRPHGWTHVLPLQQKNHPTDRQSVSLVRITLAVISCRFGCGWWTRTTNWSVWDFWDTFSLIRYNLATRRRIELLCPARQAGIITIILTSQNIWWRWLESNKQCHKTADLQSAGVTNFPTHP